MLYYPPNGTLAVDQWYRITFHKSRPAIILNSPLHKISDPLLQEKGITLYIKRDDLLHPDISGNKFRKMKYNLLKAREEGYETLLTFGGAFSNHIYAVAAAGELNGFRTVGIIRGEKYEPLNPTLAYAEKKGMVLEYINRKAYKVERKNSFLEALQEKYGRFYLVPEGGSNVAGVRGCAEMVDELTVDFDIISSCCGTGATLAGIIAGLEGRAFAIGFPVLRGGGYLKNEISSFIRSYNDRIYLNWSLEVEYHFGGYARYDDCLVHFINRFKKEHNLPLDPVYTGKMFYGLFDMISRGTFEKGTRIIAVHTGGLQGIEGFNQRFGGLIDQ